MTPPLTDSDRSLLTFLAESDRFLYDFLDHNHFPTGKPPKRWGGSSIAAGLQPAGAKTIASCIGSATWGVSVSKQACSAKSSLKQRPDSRGFFQTNSRSPSKDKRPISVPSHIPSKGCNPLRKFNKSQRSDDVNFNINRARWATTQDTKS